MNDKIIIASILLFIWVSFCLIFGSQAIIVSAFYGAFKIGGDISHWMKKP